jgi:hypothetical protein
MQCGQDLTSGRVHARTVAKAHIWIHMVAYHLAQEAKLGPGALSNVRFSSLIPDVLLFGQADSDYSSVRERNR